MEGDGNYQVRRACRGERVELPRRQKPEGAAVLDLPAVFEAMDEFPDRAVEQHRCPGRGKIRGVIDAAAAEMIDPPFGKEGEAAERTVGRSDEWAPGQAAVTE